MTRDPRRDPQPGDLVLRAQGIRWRVLDRVRDGEDELVRYQVDGLDERHEVRLSHWRRLPLKRIVHRDLKPEDVPADYLRALDAIAMTTTTERWSVEGSGRLRAIAGLSHGTWQRAVSWLRTAGLLLTRRAGRGDHYQVTEAGRRALDDRPTTGPRGPINRPTWADRSAHRPTEGGRGEVGSSSSLPLKSKTEKNNEPTNEPARGGQDDRPTDRPTGPRPAHDRPTRTLVVEHVHRLSDEDRALIGAWLASRSTLPALSAARTEPAPSSPDERAEKPAPRREEPPEVDHPAPPCSHCGHPAMALVPGPHGWFWGCPLYRQRGCPGLSLDEARAAWLEAQRAAEEQARQESMRAAREAREREDDERHRAEVAAMAEARRARRNGRHAPLAVGAAVSELLSGAARPHL